MASEVLHLSIYFDGTGNNKDLDEATKTNVGKLFDMDKSVETNLARNSGRPPAQESYSPGNGRSEKIYFDGVGSQAVKAPFLDVLWTDVSQAMVDAKDYAIKGFEGGLGAGGRDRIEHAYDCIVAFHNKNPDSEVKLNLVGYSRGAAQVRALSNMFIERGIPNRGNKPPENLIEPWTGEVNQMAIFDTVTSYGPNVGVDLNFGIHENVRNVDHFVAAHEYRDAFKGTSALGGKYDDADKFTNSSSWRESVKPGCHSQIGGGNAEEPLAALCLEEMRESMIEHGRMEIGPLTEKDAGLAQKGRQIVSDSKELEKHIFDSRLKFAQQANQVANKKGESGKAQNLDNTPFVSEQFSNIPFKRYEPFEKEVKGRDLIRDSYEVRVNLISSAQKFMVQGYHSAAEFISAVKNKLTSGNILPRSKDQNVSLDQRNFQSHLKKVDRVTSRYEQVKTTLMDSRPTAENLVAYQKPQPGHVMVDPADNRPVGQATAAETHIARERRPEQLEMNSISEKKVAPAASQGASLDAYTAHQPSTTDEASALPTKATNTKTALQDQLAADTAQPSKGKTAEKQAKADDLTNAAEVKPSSQDNLSGKSTTTNVAKFPENSPDDRSKSALEQVPETKRAVLVSKLAALSDRQQANFLEEMRSEPVGRKAAKGLELDIAVQELKSYEGNEPVEARAAEKLAHELSKLDDRAAQAHIFRKADLSPEQLEIVKDALGRKELDIEEWTSKRDDYYNSVMPPEDLREINEQTRMDQRVDAAEDRIGNYEEVRNQAGPGSNLTEEFKEHAAEAVADLPDARRQEIYEKLQSDTAAEINQAVKQLEQARDHGDGSIDAVDNAQPPSAQKTTDAPATVGGSTNAVEAKPALQGNVVAETAEQSSTTYKALATSTTATATDPILDSREKITDEHARPTSNGEVAKTSSPSLTADLPSRIEEKQANLPTGDLHKAHVAEVKANAKEFAQNPDFIKGNGERGKLGEIHGADILVSADMTALYQRDQSTGKIQHLAGNEKATQSDTEKYWSQSGQTVKTALSSTKDASDRAFPQTHKPRPRDSGFEMG